MFPCLVIVDFVDQHLSVALGTLLVDLGLDLRQTFCEVVSLSVRTDGAFS